MARPESCRTSLLPQSLWDQSKVPSSLYEALLILPREAPWEAVQPGPVCKLQICSSKALEKGTAQCRGLKMPLRHGKHFK